jgi:signal transduction histidine kinase
MDVISSKSGDSHGSETKSMIGKAAVIFLIFVLFTSALSAGDPIPALENRLRSGNLDLSQKLDLLARLSEALQDNDPKRAAEYGKEGLSILGRLEREGGKKPAIKIRLLLASVTALQNLGEHEAALAYCRIGEKLAQQIGDRHSLALFYNHGGLLLDLLGDLDQSVRQVIRAVALFEELGDRKNLAVAYKNMGNIYKEMKNSKQAMEHYLKSLHLLEELQDNLGIAKLLNNIGILYHDAGEHEKALGYYRRCQAIMDKEKWTLGQAVALINIATVMADMGDFEGSYKYNLEALELSKIIGNKRHTAILLSNIGVDLREMGRCKEALRYVYQALDIAKAIKNKDIIRNFYEELSYIYDAMKDYTNAFLYLKKYKKTNDEIFTADAQKSIAEALLNYKTAIKEKEIQQLTRDNQIKQLKLERHTLVRNFLVLLSILVLVLALVIFNRYRIKMKTEAQLKEMNASKDKLFSIIAHDLGSPLNSLLLSTAFLEEKFPDMSKEEVKDFLHQINDNAGFMSNLLDNLLNWSVSQLGKMEFTPVTMDIHTAAEETLKLMESTAREKHVRLVSRILPGTGVHADKRMVEAVMRNLVSNAVKFSHAGGEVLVSSRQTGNFLEIAIDDNGIGIPPEKLHTLFKLDSAAGARGTAGERGTGLGLILCKELVEKNSGHLDLQSHANMTRATFTLPLPQPAGHHRRTGEA